jgi:hypothetical protein
MECTPVHIYFSLEFCLELLHLCMAAPNNFILLQFGLYLSFTPRPYSPRRKSPLYPLDRKLGGPQNQSGHCGEEKHVPMPGIQPLDIQPVAHRDATDTGVIRMECTPLHNDLSL